MRFSSSLAAILVAAALLPGCNSISEKDYKFAQAITAESPSVRAEVMRDCVAARNRQPLSEQREMAAFLKVPQSKFAQTVCRRLIRAFANGRITHADLSSSASGEKILRILQGH